MPIKHLTLATHNAHKLQEFRDFLSPLGLSIHSEAEFVKGLEVEETGKTYHENAYLKAAAILPYSPYPVLADDSGIEIEALGTHFPGIYSARYLDGLSKDNREADRLILEKMKKETNRKACFHCVLTLLRKGEEPLYFEGECPGEILPALIGDHGFGYDPIFVSEEKGYRFGECNEEEKTSVSHRGKVMRKLYAYLESEK